MTLSIIKKFQLEGALRLDAEYYQPEYLCLKRKLSIFSNLKPISEIALIKSGPAYSSEAISQFYDIPIARIGDITNKVEIEAWLKLSTKEFNKFKGMRANDGDILMTMTGDPPDVGKVNYINNAQNKALAYNQRIAKISIKDNAVNNKYLFAYLSTEISRFQAERAALGIRQRNLSIEDLRSILIAIPNKKVQEEISNNIFNYLSELENSKFLYQQAENLLLEEFDLNNFKENESLFTVVNLYEVENAGRMDAEYFQEKYKKLIKKLKQNNAKKLGDLVSIKKGFEPGAEEYKEEGKLFIRVSSLSKNGINLTDEKYLSEEMYNKLKNDFEPKEGEILLTKDATPGIAYVVKDEIQGIMAGGILRLALKDKSIKDEYLALCLNSIIGQMQAERDAGGSVIMHWKSEQIKNVVIPILGKDKQQKIASLIRQSFAARAKANELLEEAKKKVEEMIEAG